MLYTKITSMMMRTTLSKKVIILWLLWPIIVISQSFIIGVTFGLTLFYLQVSSIHFLVYKNKFMRTFVFGLIVNLSLIFGLWNEKVFGVVVILVFGLLLYLLFYKDIFKMCLSLGVELSDSELAFFPYLIWRKYGLLKEQIALYEQE